MECSQNIRPAVRDNVDYTCFGEGHVFRSATRCLSLRLVVRLHRVLHRDPPINSLQPISKPLTAIARIIVNPCSLILFLSSFEEDK